MYEGQILKERYKIIKDLRRGAFGKTYLAEDKLAADNPLCVVKKLQPSTHSHSILEEARNRFELEAIALEKLGIHNRIPRLLDRFEENEEFYLVQEFIDGQDLTQEIKEGKRLNEAQTITLLHDALEVLEYIHEHGVIHRDIKPSNLIRRKSDHKIVIVDFGAVKEIETLVLSSEGRPSGSVVGTPGYMPIEHLGGRPRQIRSFPHSRGRRLGGAAHTPYYT
jgi:serine/threonine protein kinase